jgi:hypothetical protein
MLLERGTNSHLAKSEGGVFCIAQSYISCWCIYCTLNRLQWNDADHPKGDLWTDELTHEIQMEVLSSVIS